ncbi:MAG: YicC family protein [Bacteroidales bacterium]|nr:YicC family protein [Bacteroidales bacterium]
MIQSMTGFGKTTFQTEGKSVNIEIRTLNSKQLDLTVRLSPLFRELENEVRNCIATNLQRGKIEVSIYLEKAEKPQVAVDIELAKTYYEQLVNLSKELENPIESDIFCQVLRLPDVITSSKEELSELVKNDVMTALEETCQKVVSFRQEEGSHLASDFAKRIKLIDSMVDEITPFEENRIVTIRNKFVSSLSELPVQYDNNRLEQEIIFYLEKLDITEEKVRLRKHCSYFMDTMNEAQSQGKKLGFIVQEIGREVNTTGSKCNDFNIQQIVVRMKDEVEKLKEQLANVL